MYRQILIFSLLSKVNCQLHQLPVIYAAPSAVSYQSRVDVKHSSEIIAPVVYSPAVYATYPTMEERTSKLVLTPVTNDVILTPVALSFFQNLPLARALEHPISIGQNDDSEEITKTDSEHTKKYETIVEETTDNVIVTTQV